MPCGHVSPWRAAGIGHTLNERILKIPIFLKVGIWARGFFAPKHNASTLCPNKWLAAFLPTLREMGRKAVSFVEFERASCGGATNCAQSARRAQGLSEGH